MEWQVVLLPVRDGDDADKRSPNNATPTLLMIKGLDPRAAGQSWGGYMASELLAGPRGWSQWLSPFP